MSRRYGRNQKRRAREEAARLREVIEMGNGLNRYLAQKNADLQGEIDRAKALLPDGSFLFEPMAIKTGSYADAPYRIPIPDRLSESVPDSCESTMAMKSMPLDVLLTNVVLEQLQDKLHFNVLFADGQWRYAMSRRCLDGPPGTEKRMVADLSTRLATQMLLDLKTNLKYR